MGQNARLSMNKKRVFRWAIILGCLYLIVTTSQSIIDLWHSGDKLTTREAQLVALQKQQQDLLKEKKRVESESYLEKIARNDLGLSKPGEEVIIIPLELLVQTTVATPDATPNWKKWTNLFVW